MGDSHTNQQVKDKKSHNKPEAGGSVLTSPTLPIRYKDLDSKFFRRVKRRKALLVKSVITGQEPCVTRRFSNTKGLTGFLDKVRNTLPKKTDPIHIVFDSKQRWTEYTEKEGRIHLPFLCFPFFDLFLESKETLSRYLYFEFYYVGGIFSVLIKQSALANGNTGFAPFDLDRKGWAQAKQQLHYWNSYFRPESRSTLLLSPAEKALFRFVKGAQRKGSGTLPECSESLRSLWPLLAYGVMLSFQPFLKGKETCFLLNLILPQRDNGTETLLQEILCHLTLSNQSGTQELVEVTKSTSFSPSTAPSMLPQVFLYETSAQLNLVVKQVKRSVPAFGRRPSPNELPLLVGDHWCVSEFATNLRIDGQELCALSRDTNLWDWFAPAMETLAYRLKKNYRKHPGLPYQFDQSEGEFWLDDFRQALRKRYRQSYVAWKKWWKNQKITLLSKRYLVLAT